MTKTIPSIKPKMTVCPDCGWYEHGLGSSPCDPDAGKRAGLLESAVPGVPHTRLGYGYGRLVFEPDENFHIRWHSRRSESSESPRFKLDDVWLLDDLPLKAAADLVRTIAEWRKRWPKEIDRASLRDSNKAGE